METDSRTREGGREGRRGTWHRPHEDITTVERPWHDERPSVHAYSKRLSRGVGFVHAILSPPPSLPPLLVSLRCRTRNEETPGSRNRPLSERGRVYKRQLFQVRDRWWFESVSARYRLRSGRVWKVWDERSRHLPLRTLETSRKSICPNNGYRFMGKLPTIVSSLAVTIHLPRSRNNYVIEYHLLLGSVSGNRIEKKKKKKKKNGRKEGR